MRTADKLEEKAMTIGQEQLAKMNLDARGRRRRRPEDGLGWRIAMAAFNLWQAAVVVFVLLALIFK